PATRGPRQSPALRGESCTAFDARRRGAPGWGCRSVRLRTRRRNAASRRRGQDAVGQPGHGRLLRRLGVVVAQEVQEAVHREQPYFVIDGGPGVARLPPRTWQGDHDVTQPVFRARRRLEALVGRLLASSEGKHVRWLVEPAVAIVVLAQPLVAGEGHDSDGLTRQVHGARRRLELYLQAIQLHS